MSLVDGVAQRRFYNGDDHKADGSTTTKTSLLRPWIKWQLFLLGGIKQEAD